MTSSRARSRSAGGSVPPGCSSRRATSSRERTCGSCRLWRGARSCAVGIVALDGDRLWFVRQPREAIGAPDLLEIPAGKLDEEGEEPLQTGKRELAEEIGKQAEGWSPLGAFHTSPGFTNEQVHLFLATGLSDVDERPEVHENERIHVEVRPLADLEQLIAESTDSKTIIGLARLQALLAERTD